ncbi:MAG: glutamate--tRNA ligase [Fretibacterium sp.]|nr:glutamate--tRNA ligase [Fretibacterium sp.]
MIRTRFAPSPTGELHIGGARTALFNYLFAHSKPEGCFLLRVDDTDRARSLPEFERGILADLKWLGLDWDEGPYRQSERLPLYESSLCKLREKGAVYPCFCSEERLACLRDDQLRRGEPPRYDGLCRDLSEAERERRLQELREEGREPCWRFALSSSTTVFKDRVKGEVTFPAGSMGDFVVVRSDGMPVYLFTSVVDDHMMEITHIIRGDEHLPNTARQQAIFEALNWVSPVVAHIPMILSKARQKLSKRTGSTPIREYRERGYLPKALNAYLAGLSWACPEETDRFSLKDLAEAFSLKNLSASPSIHDETQLLYWQKEATKRRGGLRLCEDLATLDPRFAALNPTSLKALIDDVLDEYPLLPQLRDALAFLLTRPEGAQERRAWMEDLASALRELAPWSQERLNDVLRAFMKDQGLKGREFFHPLRRVLTGCDKGAALPLVLEALGREEVLARLLGDML